MVVISKTSCSSILEWIEWAPYICKRWIEKYMDDITRWREDMNFVFEWQEHKIHIFELTCNFLFIIWTINIYGRDWKAWVNTSLILGILTKGRGRLPRWPKDKTVSFLKFIERMFKVTLLLSCLEFKKRIKPILATVFSVLKRDPPSCSLNKTMMHATKRNPVHWMLTTMETMILSWVSISRYPRTWFFSI